MLLVGIRGSHDVKHHRLAEQEPVRLHTEQLRSHHYGTRGYRVKRCLEPPHLLHKLPGLDFHGHGVDGRGIPVVGAEQALLADIARRANAAAVRISHTPHAFQALRSARDNVHEADGRAQYQARGTAPQALDQAHATLLLKAFHRLQHDARDTLGDVPTQVHDALLEPIPDRLGLSQRRHAALPLPLVVHAHLHQTVRHCAGKLARAAKDSGHCVLQ
mmetsp:Transcript_25141/g.70458  ORF Transcript_25141/g.70458 Transcript_25141/m.70458 type:complete len:217 (-) Transcript_25141:1713-2363(-)